MTAPLRRWVAFVWPAIALGPVGQALAIPFARLAGLDGAPSLPASGLAGSLSLLVASAEASGGPMPSGQTAKTSASRHAPVTRLLPHGGGMGLLATVITVLGALIGVVALARLTVGEDFFSTRWLH